MRYDLTRGDEARAMIEEVVGEFAVWIFW